MLFAVCCHPIIATLSVACCCGCQSTYRTLTSQLSHSPFSSRPPQGNPAQHRSWPFLNHNSPWQSKIHRYRRTCIPVGSLLSSLYQPFLCHFVSFPFYLPSNIRCFLSLSFILLLVSLCNIDSLPFIAVTPAHFLCLLALGAKPHTATSTRHW